MGKITETVKILIIINVIVYAGSLFLGNSEVAYRLFSLYYFEHPNFQIWQPITHMFMHDKNGISHILFNMFGLYMFGSAMEAQWGRNKFLFFYFSAGLGAAFIHLLVGYFYVHRLVDPLVETGLQPAEIFDLMSEWMRQARLNEDNSFSFSLPEGINTNHVVPALENYFATAVGASGAIFGVLVAFGITYPNAALMLLFLPVPVKAKYFIPVLLLIDLFSGLTGFSMFGQNIANWAHLGGALFGFVMAYYWKKKSTNNTRWD